LKKRFQNRLKPLLIYWAAVGLSSYDDWAAVGLSLYDDWAVVGLSSYD
jgi:hypothetical protein